MAKYMIEKLPGEPIVVMKVHENYDPSEQPEEGAKVLNRIFDEAGEPVFFVLDLTRMQGDLKDIMVGVDPIGRGGAALFRHPNIREIVAVTQDPIIRIALEGRSADTYGGVSMVIFETLREAMDYVRKH